MAVCISVKTVVKGNRKKKKTKKKGGKLLLEGGEKTKTWRGAVALTL